MKSFITGLFATITGLITLFLLFFKKTPPNSSLNTAIQKKDDEAKKLKTEISILEDKQGKPVEEKSLESELDYWSKEKK